MGEHDARRRAAWRFVRAVIRSQLGGVIGAAVSGLLWQAGAVSAPLIVTYAIGHVLTVIAVAVVLLAIDWQLALVVLIPLPLISVAGWAYSRQYHTRTRLLQEGWADAATLVEETVSGIRVVKGLGAGQPLAAEFRRRSDRIVGRALDIARLDAVFMPV